MTDNWLPKERKPRRPRVLRAAWQDFRAAHPMHRAYVHRNGLRVIAGEEHHKDGRWWLHVSASRADEMPSWEDLREVKDQFIGRDKLAIQVLPPIDQYVNVNPHVLHLYHCLDDASPLPDFRCFIEGMALL